MLLATMLGQLSAGEIIAVRTIKRSMINKISITSQGLQKKICIKLFDSRDGPL